MNLVTPCTVSLSEVGIGEFPVRNAGNDASIGDGGGEIGQGGGVCVQETEIGRSGSLEEKDMDSTLVFS